MSTMDSVLGYSARFINVYCISVASNALPVTLGRNFLISLL